MSAVLSPSAREALQVLGRRGARPVRFDEAHELLVTRLVEADDGRLVMWAQASFRAAFGAVGPRFRWSAEEAS